MQLRHLSFIPDANQSLMNSNPKERNRVLKRQRLPLGALGTSSPPKTKKRMQTSSLLPVIAFFTLISHLASANQADDVTIAITGQTAGATPFLSQLTLVASDTSVLKSIQFTVTPRAGSVARPLSGTFSNDYLVSRGYEEAATGEIFLPVYGLYADFTNTVTLTYRFLDGSTKQDSLVVTTASFDDPCGYDTPTVLQPRTDSTSLSYDFIMIHGACSDFSPAVIDTDGALRWVGPAGIASFTATFFDNAFYIVQPNTSLYRLDLDGTITLLRDYSDLNITSFHHNIDRGKTGVFLEANTDLYIESVVLEVDPAGNVLQTWNLADIISAAMVAGGDDPGQFVKPRPDDWFHSNGVAYNRADDSLIISSRENFLICLDYKTAAIKWILGDSTKNWYQFPSLRQYALALAPGSLPPIGQHSPSITYDQNLLVMDNGAQSRFQIPPGANRGYASARKYRIDLQGMVATAIWNYTMDETILSPFCSSVYEDAPLNYLIDYAVVGGFEGNPLAQLLGLDSLGEKIFYYQYPTLGCQEAYNSTPLHLENTAFPTVGPQTLNLSTRGLVGVDETALIAGLIVTGTDSKTVVLRALGPSLGSAGLSDALTDPVLTLFDASGAAIETNNSWQSGANAAQVTAMGLEPTDPEEAVILATLMPAAYTAVVTSKDSTPGISLVELYDLSPSSNSTLANISTRGSVGVGDNVLISGLIVGAVENATVLVRALGPSLGSAVNEPLSDPALTIYDANGSVIASNDNWQDDVNASAVEQNQLAPENEMESAIVLHPPAGAYSAIVTGADGNSGICLVEVYDLD